VVEASQRKPTDWRSRLNNTTQRSASEFFVGRAVRASCPRPAPASQVREPDSPSGFSAEALSNPLLHPCSKLCLIAAAIVHLWIWESESWSYFGAVAFSHSVNATRPVVEKSVKTPSVPKSKYALYSALGSPLYVFVKCSPSSRKVNG
jgi:hypothetical protein